MRRKLTTALAVIGGTVMATAVPTAASAIDGGSVSNNPAVVHLYSSSSDYSRAQVCSGVQVSESVILTAKHCDLGGSWLVSWPTGSNGGYGASERTTDATSTPGGDFAVVRLSTSHPLPSYPKVNARYVTHAGDAVTLYGARGGQQRTIDGAVVGEGFESFGGPTIQVRTPGGGSRAGDSGGPLLIDGEVVGVLSQGNDLEDSWYTRISGESVAALLADQLPGTGVGNVGGVSSAPYYEIKNVASGLALDTRDTTVGAQITQQRFTGATSQQWTLIREGDNVRVVNRQTEQVIGIPGSSTTPGETAVQWTAVGVADQAWSKAQQPDGTFTFTNANSGQVLAPTSTGTGASVAQNPAQGSDAEKWTLVRVG